MKAALIFPHQLFAEHPAIAGVQKCFLVEDPLFFSQYQFHRQKIVLHRASMSAYADRLRQKRKQVVYVSAYQLYRTEDLGEILHLAGIVDVQYVDPCDDWLSQRLTRGLEQYKIQFSILPDPHFLTPIDYFEEFDQRPKKKWFFTEFYIDQRKRLGILLDQHQKPTGGKWSFDTENRKKLPKQISIPDIKWPAQSPSSDSVATEIERQFPRALGSGSLFRYPVTNHQAALMLDDFLEQRLAQFGAYEDAIDRENSFLFHSILTPALNIGLLSPSQVITAALDYGDAHSVPLNSLEGFVRQVIGWREYIRGVYLVLGRKQRSRNYWQHSLPMPAAFYDGSTGIEPVDVVIQRVLKDAYCHHIERLMILGNFMLLCEIDPNEVYRWFMELFIDAYDWVMVPNVYGMSQFADGGMITTKPYISGSAYVLKMSNFKRGDWCPIWDALYWRFVDKHRDFFASNPRMTIMVAQCKRMGDKLKQHHQTADNFLRKLHGR